MIILLPIPFPHHGPGLRPRLVRHHHVVWLEIGFITPPVGLKPLVIPEPMPGAGARECDRRTTPYVILMVVLVAILFFVPELALWLPLQMMPASR